MRILMVHKNWWRLGGVETHMFFVRDILESMGHEVVPFAMEDPSTEPAPTTDHFVSPVEFRSGGLAAKAKAAERAVLGLETRRKLGALLDEFPVDAAHVLHAYHQLGPLTFRTLHRRGVPTVLSMHDYKLGCPSYRLFNDATGEICTKCFDERFAFAYAPVTTKCWDGSAAGGAMLSVEAITSRLLRSYTRGPLAFMTVNELQTVGLERMGIPRDRIHVVPHFADLGDGEPDRTEDPDRPVVLYVGRLVVEKGVDVLIDAAAAGDFSLRLLGDGRDRADLEARADRLGVDATFVGDVDRAVVDDEMLAATVLVVPSIWHEVWGLIINEAIVAGLPVVGTDVGGVSDLLADSRGVLVPHGDPVALAGAVNSLLTDPAERRRLAARARAWAATELTREQFVENLRAVYSTAGLTL